MVACEQFDELGLAARAGFRIDPLAQVNKLGARMETSCLHALNGLLPCAASGHRESAWRAKRFAEFALAERTLRALKDAHLVRRNVQHAYVVASARPIMCRELAGGRPTFTGRACSNLGARGTAGPYIRAMGTVSGLP